MEELEEREARLAAVEEQVRVCTRCPLHATRRHGVPGEGPVDSAIMFIGEGPGANEDRTGRPFVGAAGKFLEQLLATIGLTREDVYITNVVKSRPPNNRDPLPHEVDACKPYLVQQLRIVDPEIIVTLGKHATQRWVPNASISKIHGQAFTYGRRLIVPMFHPAAALHQPQWKPLIEADFLRLPDYIDDARRLRLELEATSADPQGRLM